MQVASSEKLDGPQEIYPELLLDSGAEEAFIAI